MNIRALIAEIHDSVQFRHELRDPYNTAGDSDLRRLRDGCAELYRTRNMAGLLPPEPPTLRGRIGGLIVRAVQRMLFWYTPAVTRFHNQTASLVGEFYTIVEKQTKTIESLRLALTALEGQRGVDLPRVEGLSPAVSFQLQDHFRGTESDTKGKLAGWLDAISHEQPPAGQWLDIGCGRGEWLQLVAARGQDALGIDDSELSVARCRERGLIARRGEAIDYLREVPDGSLSVITAFQVVEHLGLATLEALIALASRKLKRGGLLVFETPDPANLLMATRYFWNDPTHVRPIPFELMQWIFGYFGLNVVKHLRLNPFPENEQLGYGELEPVARLNGLLYGPRDYGVIGRREN